MNDYRNIPGQYDRAGLHSGRAHGGFGGDFTSDDEIARQPPPVNVGPDERRMQVRAYNHWASLLCDRPFPQIGDLLAAKQPDFIDHAVVLDFSEGVADPRVTMLGKALARECGVIGPVERLSEVPDRSLLSRITDHCLQILANEAPIGFEAEFVDQRGNTLLCRGILLPFAGDGTHVQHIMGVVNWKELADPVVTAELRRELEVSLGAAHPHSSISQLGAWADGPAPVEPAVGQTGNKLAIELAQARDAVEMANAMAARSRDALHAAIGRAWDLAISAEADPQGLLGLAAEVGLTTAPRSPMMAVLKLVFGASYGKSQLAGFATVLAHARRCGLGRGQLMEYIAATKGGLNQIVREERVLRRRERVQHEGAVR